MQALAQLTADLRAANEALDRLSATLVPPPSMSALSVGTIFAPCFQHTDVVTFSDAASQDGLQDLFLRAGFEQHDNEDVDEDLRTPDLAVEHAERATLRNVDTVYMLLGRHVRRPLLAPRPPEPATPLLTKHACVQPTVAQAPVSSAFRFT
jgi:hypothetical protein